MNDPGVSPVGVWKGYTCSFRTSSLLFHAVDTQYTFYHIKEDNISLSLSLSLFETIGLTLDWQAQWFIDSFEICTNGEVVLLIFVSWIEVKVVLLWRLQIGVTILCGTDIHTNTIFLIKIHSSALIVGKDYPHPDGIEYVRRKWKEALRDPQNCQLLPNNCAQENERILRKAVGKGRYVIREMEGTIQLKKYRTMRRRYGQVSRVLRRLFIDSFFCTNNI